VGVLFTFHRGKFSVPMPSARILSPQGAPPLVNEILFVVATDQLARAILDDDAGPD
jgi:hypothetical protein